MATSVRVNPFGAKNPTYAAKVSFSQSILQTDSGLIKYMAILVAERGCNPVDDLLNYGVLNPTTEWPKILNWYEANSVADGDCIRQYQTTPAL